MQRRFAVSLVTDLYICAPFQQQRGYRMVGISGGNEEIIPGVGCAFQQQEFGNLGVQVKACIVQGPAVEVDPENWTAG